jgi:hypothetical protein
MEFDEENNLSPEEKEAAFKIILEAEKNTKYKQYFDTFEFESFTTNIELNFPKDINFSKKDEKYFIFLLFKLQSLNKLEKLDILNNFHNFSSEKISNLVNILETEITTFNLFVSKKPSFISQASKMKFDSIRDWQEIEKLYIKKINKKVNRRFYGFDFYANPYDIEKILIASKLEPQYFFGGIIRAKDSFLEQITYFDEIPLEVIYNPCLYHAHEEEFEKKLNKFGVKLNQISYFRNKNLGEILTELNIKFTGPDNRFERAKVLLKLKKQCFISKILNYLLFS